MSSSYQRYNNTHVVSLNSMWSINDQLAKFVYKYRLTYLSTNQTLHQRTERLVDFKFFQYAHYIQTTDVKL